MSEPSARKGLKLRQSGWMAVPNVTATTAAAAKSTAPMRVHMPVSPDVTPICQSLSRPFASRFGSATPGTLERPVRQDRNRRPGAVQTREDTGKTGSDDGPLAHDRGTDRQVSQPRRADAPTWGTAS